jgi:regulator of protease activity HflC (stomatin/prohibitin superfamily)
MFKFIDQSTTGVKTRFGKYIKKCKPGLSFYIPIFEKIDIVSNKISQTSFEFSTKTNNDVFAKIGITIEYVIKEENSEKALFSMDNPINQIGNNVENVLISSTSNMDLNTLFESRKKLCNDIAEKMQDMENNGFTIIKTLVTSIDVDNSVRDALNKVYESKKILEATQNEVEGQKIKMVKAAEAEKESKILQGEGSAGQQNAVLLGFSENFKQKFCIEPEKKFNFVLNVQHRDMLKEVGSNSKSNVIFLNHDIQNNDIIKGLYSKNTIDPENLTNLSSTKLKKNICDNGFF